MNKFDKNIKHKLDNYASPVNKDMWDRVAANLPIQESTSNKNLLWSIFGVAIISLALISYHFLSKDSTNSTKYFEKELAANSTNQEILDGTNSYSNTITQGELSPISETTEANAIKSGEQAKTTVKKSQIETSTKNSNYKNTSINSKNTFNVESKLGSVKSESKINVNRNDVREVVDINSENREVASLYRQYNTIINKAKSLNFTTEEVSLREEEEEVPTLGYIIPELRTTSGLDGLRGLLNGKQTVCPTFANVRFGIFVEGFYSNDFGIRELSYNGPVSEGDYLNSRNKTERANYSFSTGLRLSFLLPSNIGVKTGVQYAQINETFKYIDDKHRQTKTVIIKEYTWENGIVTDSSEITKEVEVPGELNVISQNKYKIIDIPLLLTYEWGYKKRLYYSVTAGPMFNLQFSQKGKFLNPETLTPVDFTTNSGNYQAFSTNVGASMYVSFALNYQLGNGTDIFVEPNMRHYLNKTTLNSYLLNQKYTVFGVGFGVKHKI